MRLLLCTLFIIPLLVSSNVDTLMFDDPIDAISFGVDSDEIHLSVSTKTVDGWTGWQALEIEKEFDPLLRESNLVLFPEEVTAVRVRGSQKYAAHPIRVSHEPTHYDVAASSPMVTPRILTRRQWGADETLLVSGTSGSRSDEPTIDETTVTPSQRVTDCELNQQRYPDEFKTVRTVNQTSSGEPLRWPQRYSPEIKRLVVHHTALAVAGDTRPGAERMRALYEYHANSRGWGDIGYNYVIDESGQIYEGRSGGKYVVAGHVYCGNVGTIGIALMGNFENEQPTQKQMSSLKWLLDDLAHEYDIDLERTTRFHGELSSPIVGHGDLISTVCPGYYIRKTLTQIRAQTIAQVFDAPINFPELATAYENNTAQRLAQRLLRFGSSIQSSPELSAVGSTNITVRPGGQTTLQLKYRAAATTIPTNGRITTVKRSHPRIGVWQGTKRVRDELTAPETIRAGETLIIPVRIQAPRQSGTYDLKFGALHYIIRAEGRRTRSVVGDATQQSYDPAEERNIRLGQRVTPTTSVSVPTTDTTTASIQTSHDTTIRVRLSYEGDHVTIRSDGHTLTWNKEGALCGGQTVARLGNATSISTVLSWNTTNNRFRGVLECRIINGELVLLNELGLEEYLAGLSEEPDTEQYEKQRAFAVAARSYAAHYTQDANRKFPGMPYDADDSPARFQKYSGMNFETHNPNWLEAVKSTAGQVITKNGEIVKTAYFSSDDGRTRSPAENGWANFPFAEVFQSKPDPWCTGLPLRGHGVGMSGCGADGQAREGKTAEQILEYYYPGTEIMGIGSRG